MDNLYDDSWYNASPAQYPSWTPGTEYSGSNAAAFAAGQAITSRNHGSRVFATQANHGGFVGAAPSQGAFNRSSEDQGRVLIANDEEVKQDGQYFHLPKMV